MRSHELRNLAGEFYLSEAARFLKMPKRTVLRLANLGVLPCSRRRRGWRRFNQAALARWMQERNSEATRSGEPTA